jgi:hypothetical protein
MAVNGSSRARSAQLPVAKADAPKAKAHHHHRKPPHRPDAFEPAKKRPPVNLGPPTTADIGLAHGEVEGHPISNNISNKTTSGTSTGTGTAKTTAGTTAKPISA